MVFATVQNDFWQLTFLTMSSHQCVNGPDESWHQSCFFCRAFSSQGFITAHIPAWTIHWTTHSKAMALWETMEVRQILGKVTTSLRWLYNKLWLYDIHKHVCVDLCMLWNIYNRLLLYVKHHGMSKMIVVKKLKL